MATLSVVLATKDRPGPGAAVVAAVLHQLPADGEVVVVDQSIPELAEQLRASLVADPRVRWCPSWPPSLPVARNVGVRAARGDLVLFLDDDVHLHPGCLAAHVAAYADPRVGGVVGRIVEARLVPNSPRVRNDVGWDGRIRTRLDGNQDTWVTTLKGANMSLRRVALEAAGGFDPGFGGTSLLEDADLSARVRGYGWRLRFVAAAAVDHDHLPAGGVRHDPSSTVGWRFHNTARFLRKHRGWLGVGLAVPTFSALAVRESWRDRRPDRALVLLAAFARGARAVAFR